MRGCDHHHVADFPTTTIMFIAYRGHKACQVEAWVGIQLADVMDELIRYTAGHADRRDLVLGQFGGRVATGKGAFHNIAHITLHVGQ